MMKAAWLVALACIGLGAGSCSQMNWSARSTSVDLLETGLVGWQQIGGQVSSPAAWRLENGILTDEGKGGNWLSTVGQYGDFELSLEFRVSPRGNGGVFLRAPHEGDPAYTGMEIQILDDYAPEYAQLKPAQYTGSIYDVQAPSERVSKHAGEWQRMVITCRGSTVRIVLNGRTIVDADLTHFSDKYRTHPGLTRQGGYIGLQDHTKPVAFRNIRIRTLSK